MFRRIALLNILLLALAAVGSAQSASQKESAPKGKQPAGKTKAWKVQNAMSAAPRAIAKNATIVDQPGKEGGEMLVIRKGTNDWTCMPDDPSTPANDPMCLDKNAADWAKAWKSHTEPHLMLFGVKLDPSVYSSDANSGTPWIMWAGTHYEHLMIPVK